MSKPITTKKWFMTRFSRKKVWLRILSIVLVVVPITYLSFFAVSMATYIASVTMLSLSALCLNVSRWHDTEGEVNEILSHLGLVQASEGIPVLTYDTHGRLISVFLGNMEFKNPNYYLNIGDDVYIAHFETDAGLLLVVIEGSPKSKNKNAVAFRSLTKS